MNRTDIRPGFSNFNLPKTSPLQRFCWILFFTWCTAAMAQPARQFSFTHYGTAGGLISNQANALAQDSDGFIWIGTTDGLQRFDGIRYLSFRHQEKDSSSLPSNLVWQLLTDRQNQLWVLLADGRVGIFNTHTFRFKPITTRFKFPVTPNSFAKHLLTDSSGHIFYFVEGGEILTYDPGRREFSVDFNFFPGFSDKKILDFYPEPGSQRYWFSLDDDTLREFDYTTRQVRQPVSAALPVAHRHLFIDQQKHLWFTTELAGQQPAAGAYDLHTGKPYLVPSVLPNDRHVLQDITGFLQQQDGTIWIRGLHVLARFLPGSRQFQFVQNGYLNERSIQYERIHKIFEDREKSIWVATDNNGVYRFNPASEFISNHRHQDPLSGQLGEGGVICFIPLESGFLTVTRGDGWFRYDSAFNPVPLQPGGAASKTMPNAYSASIGTDGKTAWIGIGSGFMGLNRKSLAVTKKEFPELHSPVKQILEDQQGTLWLGTNDGLFHWNGKTLNSVIPAVSVNKLLLDSKQVLWVGTPENGLFLIDPRSGKTIDHFTTSGDPGRRLPEMGISSLLEYDSTSVYITTGNRLVRYDRRQQSFQTVVDYGLISGFNTAIEKDRKGYLWLTSTSGLYRLNPIKNILVRFTREDGIDNDHFEQSASAFLPDGQMLFGSTNHFISFNPEKPVISSVYPTLSITNFKVLNNPLPLDSILQLPKLELDHQHNSITIEFSHLLYNTPYRIKYQLENLDKTWMPAEKNATAVYNYLPPGTYQFLLKTIDEEGRESAIVKALQITITPPFWKTIWFYAIVGLAIAALLYWLDRERMARKAALEKMRSDIADDLHQEVNTALSNINILSEMAHLKSETDLGKSREYIEQIHAKSRNMMTVMDDMLWSISPDNDSMTNVIDRFKEHVDSLRSIYGQSIWLDIEPKVSQLSPNMKLRKNILWLLKSGSANMMRTGARDLHIYVGLQRQQLLFRMDFNNSSMDLQQLSNLLQRQELTKKIQEVKARLLVKQQKEQQVIELFIPV